MEKQKTTIKKLSLTKMKISKLDLKYVFGGHGHGNGGNDGNGGNGASGGNNPHNSHCPGNEGQP